MNAQNSTSSISPTVDFSAYYKATVEEQQRIAVITENARKRKLELQTANAQAKKVNAIATAAIQRDLAKQLIDVEKATNEQYKKEMTEAGFSADVYPLEMSVLAVDQKVITPFLATTGKVINSIGVGAKAFGLGIWKRATSAIK